VPKIVVVDEVLIKLLQK